MSVQALEILKGYITCEDNATRNKFFNLLDSFWHKADGKLLKNYTVNQAGDKTFVFLDKDGNQESITLPALPNSKPISFIDGLADALSNKVAVVPGKQLSTEDFTTALLQKLNGLTNYVHPDFHQIAEVEGLAQALSDLAPPEGFGFSELNFSPAYRDKIDNYPIGHYAAPVDDLAALAALPEADIPPYQRRPVKSEKVDYYYIIDANQGDVAPDDQTNGTGFWVRDLNAVQIIDALTSTAIDKALSANQGKILKDLIDANTAKFADYILLSEKGSANGVAILDGNGKIIDSQLGDLSITDTISPAETTLTDFVANNASYNFQQGDVVIIDDGAGNVSHYIFKGGDKSAEVNYSQLNATKIPISGVIGLQTALDSKQNRKPTKVIPNSTQYTAVAEDKDKFLVFQNAIDFIIPANLFSADDIIEGQSKADFVTVVQDAGMTVNVVSSQSKEVPQYGFFGVRFDSATVAGLYGQLKPI